MQTAINLEPIRGEPLHLEQYFGLWAVEETRFLQMFDRVSKMDLGQHVRVNLQIDREGTGDRGQGTGYEQYAIAGPPGKASPSSAVRTQEKAIAVIDVSGTLMKRGSSLSASSSMIRLRQQVRAAARDEGVAAIVLRIDSPGGTTSGTADLAKEVAAAAKEKPCVAFVEDLCASAAYWIASQCDQIFANDATALVGSIGTFIGLYDQSGQYAAAGVRAVVLKSGRYKAAGFAGSEITDEQKAYWQQIVDLTQGEFTAAVSAGRKIDAAKVAEMADGRVHLAGDALKMGLIDGVKSFDALLTEMQMAVNPSPSASPSKNLPRSTTQMSEENKTVAQTAPSAPAAATIAEMKAGCPGASADFLCRQLEANATLDQAKSAWLAEQNAKLAATEKELQAAKAELAAKKPAPGVEALGDGSGRKQRETAADPIAEWNEKVEATMSARKCGRQAAQGIVGNREPELRKAFVEAYNAAHPRHASE